jgi:two-component system nitrate/nitrite response regulator NarL
MGRMTQRLLRIEGEVHCRHAGHRVDFLMLVLLKERRMNDLDGFSLLLVDDHPLFREGLLLALQQRQPGMRAVGVASPAEARATLLVDPQGFDLVLIDHRLPGESGLLAASRLRIEFPAAACALMSGIEEPGLADRARAAGLAAFIPKSLDVSTLMQAMAGLARGGSYFPASGAEAPVLDLTPRQMQVVELAGRGASNKEIAQALGIAPHTVKNHFAQIFEKLGASNRAQAVTLAFDRADVANA